MHNSLKRENVSILSPLRYPGSKRRLAGYIKQTLYLNEYTPSLFIEPFAGGASVALQLLNDGIVEQIGLIEIDPLVASFWQTVFFDADWLVEQVETIEITLKQWDKFKNNASNEKRWNAIACLFLNRTSFSGILANAGPLGGRRQNSNYLIDCRFPRKTLVKRIRQAEKLKDRVAFVWNYSWTKGVSLIRYMQKNGSLPSKNVFFYMDPPFFEKAGKLYRYYFDLQGHTRLRDYLLDLKDAWLLSYDFTEKVADLYADTEFGSINVELLYSSSSTPGSKTAQEIILTNLECLPGETRLWRRHSEWENERIGLSRNTNIIKRINHNILKELESVRDEHDFCKEIHDELGNEKKRCLSIGT